jgi:hypothetical protein
MTTDHSQLRKPDRRWWVFTLLAMGAGSLLLLLALGGVAAYWLGTGLGALNGQLNAVQNADDEARQFVEQFLQQSAAGEIESAYSRLSPDLQQRQSLLDFRAAVGNQPGLAKFRPAALAGPVNLSHHKTTTSLRQFTATMIDRTSTTTVRVRTWKDTTGWKVSEFHIHSNP